MLGSCGKPKVRLSSGGSMANDPIEQAQQILDRALAARDQADISWIHPAPSNRGGRWREMRCSSSMRWFASSSRSMSIEFGAGLSTKVLARACVQIASPCAISSIDHDPEFGVSDTRAIVESTKDLTLASQIAPLVAQTTAGSSCRPIFGIPANSPRPNPPIWCSSTARRWIWVDAKEFSTRF